MHLTHPCVLAVVLAASPAFAQPEPPKNKEPGRGDFDAGGQVRLPNGSDESGRFATFNWVAFDLRARDVLLDSVPVNANVPVAIIHPGTIDGGAVQPSS